jgi:hypothetical protein
MTLKDPPDPATAELIPLIRYAVERKIASAQTDYWDYATLIELGVLGKDRELAHKSVSQALDTQPSGWMTETTARNLRLIREAREKRNEGKLAWDTELEKELNKSRV